MFARIVHLLAAVSFAAGAPSVARAAGSSQEGLRPPRLIEKVEARFPEEARREGASGTVVVQIVIDRQGKVAGAKIVRGAGHGFDEAALDAARKLRFEPATRDGVAIPVQLDYEIHFRFMPAIPQPPVVPAIPMLESVVEGEKPFTAASASTVRDQEFLLRPRATPEDILRVVPGLVLAQHQGGGKADQIFLRGFDADHGTDVSVNLDGIPVNMPSHAHGQGYTDLHFLIPEAIERIEIVKGPYEAQYGDFDTAGAVNLVTREKFEQSQVTVQGGVFPTVLARHDADGGPPRGASYRILGIAAPQIANVHPWAAAEVSGTQGPFLHGERLQRYSLFAKAGFELSPTVKVSLLGMAYGSSWIGSGQIPERLVEAGFLDRFGAIDPTEGGDTQRQQIVAALQARSGEAGTFTAAVSVIRYRLALFNDFTFQTDDPVHADEIEQDDRRITAAANVKYERRDRGFVPGLLYTTAGAQLRGDDVDAQLWKVEKRLRLASCLDIANPCVDTNDRQIDAAAFVQLDWRPVAAVRLVLGLRHDFFAFEVRSGKPGGGIDPGHPDPAPPAVRRSITSPKASLVVTPAAYLDLFFNFGNGFHSNDARSAVETGGAGALPRAVAYEIGARARLLDDRLDLAAAVWRLDLASELVWSGDAGGTEPSGPTRRQGIDLEARYRVLPWLFADFDVSLAKAQFRQDFGNGQAVALAPPRIVTGGLTARHPSGMFASLRLRHIGPRPGSQFDADTPLDPGNPAGPRVPPCNPSLDASDRVQSRCYLVADGYTVFDLALGYRTRRFGIDLVAENLTNAAYREAQFGNVSRVLSPPDGNAVSRSGAPFVPEPHPVQDIHYTPGSPFGLQAAVTFFF